MAPNVITSRQNPLIKELQSIRDSRSSPLIFLEGPRLVQEALLSNIAPEIVVICDQFPETAFLDPIRDRAKQHFTVSEAVFRAITDVENPQGLLAILRRPTWKWEDLLAAAPAPLLILDGLQDPGNAATIVRTAEASGAAGIVTTPNTAHLFSPKALRGAMGSTLRLPILEHRSIDDILAQLKTKKYATVGALAQIKGLSVMPYTELNWKKPWALVVGQEGQGLSAAWKSKVEKQIHVPMKLPVESLNVAASVAILLYESARQRGNLR